MKTLHILKHFNLIILTISVFLFGCTNVELAKLPAVSTKNISDITATTAQSGGNIGDDKGEAVIKCGICWSTSNSPTIKDSISINPSSNGEYMSQLHNLTPNTLYYVRAFATNRFGTAYGEFINFTTSVDSVKLTTIAITNITTTTATGGGIVINDGNGIIHERGICWATTSSPTIMNYKTIEETGKSSFTCNINNLTRATTYYVRAYAKNDIAISYGSQVAFNTLAELPTVSTNLPSNIGESSVQIDCNVIDNGGIELIAKGLCYGTNHNPTLTDSHTNNASTSGIWTTILTGINPTTTYFIRAYATNIAGTTYGNEISFKTLASPHSAGTVNDIEGNLYQTITIGNQTWMIENLKTTKYSDGTPIQYASTLFEWSAHDTAAYGWYNNDITNKTIYGALYNWYAVDSKKLAPVGWHVPTYEEWSVLENYLIINGYNYDGTTVGNKIAKSLAATTLWDFSDNTGAIGNNRSENNRSGFSAFPSGAANNFPRGTLYNGIGSGCRWLTATEIYSTNALLVGIHCSSNFSQHSSNDKGLGFSVRCVKD